VRRTVLEEPAPAFSTAQAEEIAERAFELRASAHPLASERNQVREWSAERIYAVLRRACAAPATVSGSDTR
jgi:hypothetical protein